MAATHPGTPCERDLIRALLTERYHGAIEITGEMVDAVIGGLEPRSCGESDGMSICTVRPGDHDPASNCPDGPVYHVAADGARWTGPMSEHETAMAREAVA